MVFHQQREPRQPQVIRLMPRHCNCTVTVAKRPLKVTLANSLHFPNILVHENAHSLQGCTDEESILWQCEGLLSPIYSVLYKTAVKQIPQAQPFI